MSELEFQIKVRSLDNLQIEVQARASMLVSDLKNLIFTQSQIPVDSQRLLFQGKNLQNSRELGTYDILGPNTVYLVGNLERGGEEEQFSEVIRSAIESFPVNFLRNRRGSAHRRRDIELSEKIETIYQNLMTLENIINNSRRFCKGQWVDVKDTVNQWLEGQVLDLGESEQAATVLVHYNGWPSRWDEWIDVQSPRIQFFRTHTHQSLTSPMHSPYPVSPIDAEGIRCSSSNDLNDYILQSIGVFEQIQVMLDNYVELGDGSGLIPVLLDRFGRLMSDFAGVITNGHRQNEENESISSSLITNESGVSVGSGLRFNLQVPVMPTPAELSVRAPRIGPDLDIQIHAFFALRNLEQEGRNALWDGFL